MEDAALARTASMHDRIAMYNGNALKIGLFGANCSSGRAVTKVPERWSGSWEDNLALAQLADAAGMDLMAALPRDKDAIIKPGERALHGRVGARHPRRGGGDGFGGCHVRSDKKG